MEPDPTEELYSTHVSMQVWIENQEPNASRLSRCFRAASDLPAVKNNKKWLLTSLITTTVPIRLRERIEIVFIVVSKRQGFVLSVLFPVFLSLICHSPELQKSESELQQLQLLHSTWSPDMTRPCWTLTSLPPQTVSAQSTHSWSLLFYFYFAPKHTLQRLLGLFSVHHRSVILKLVLCGVRNHGKCSSLLHRLGMFTVSTETSQTGRKKCFKVHKSYKLSLSLYSCRNWVKIHLKSCKFT